MKGNSFKHLMAVANNTVVVGNYTPVAVGNYKPVVVGNYTPVEEGFVVVMAF